MVESPLRQANDFRPDLNDVERFVKQTPRARAIFLNSPHNPTGGVATEDDLRASPTWCAAGTSPSSATSPTATWSGPAGTRRCWRSADMMDQVVAAYTFSKSYSMSGWRLGYAVSSPRVIDTLGKMINTSLSCVPPLVQLAGQAAIENDAAERDEVMGRFQKKVELLVAELRRVNEVNVLMPAGTFYVFPDVSAICRRLGITSHGLAMYLLEGADDRLGVACLGGECFGAAGQGFLRFTCAEPDERLVEAVRFLADAATRNDRVARYLAANPKYRIG